MDKKDEALLGQVRISEATLFAILILRKHGVHLYDLYETDSFDELFDTYIKAIQNADILKIRDEYLEEFMALKETFRDKKGAV